MNEEVKVALKSLAKAVVDRGVVAIGVALLSHGILAPGQISGFDQVASGIVMILIGALVGWYRDHGKALVQAKVGQLNAQIDALTKSIAQTAKTRNDTTAKT